MSSGKKRSSNFTLREKEILISLVKKYFHILENKKTNAVFNKQKTEYWEIVAKEYNALQTTGPRTAAQLKSIYEQLKKLAKQHKAEDKVESLKTGGGIYIPKMTTLDDQILDLIKENYFCIDNKFDSNTDVSLQQSATSHKEAKRIPGEKLTMSNDSNISNSNVNNEENIIYVYEDSEFNTNVPSFWDNTDENMHTENVMPHCSNLLLSKDRDRHKDLVNPNNKKQIINNETSYYVANDTLMASTPNIVETPRVDQKTKEKKGQKRKMQILKSKTNENEKITEKKMQLIDKKISLLDTMQKVEEENLKGKILDNEIKDIIKEKELIILRAKKLQYDGSLL